MYKVIWSQRAIRQLEVMMLIGTFENRLGVTHAVQAIDEMLREDPDQVGESRPHGRRITYSSPLAVYFRLNVRLKLVNIDQVWPTIWYR